MSLALLAVTVLPVEVSQGVKKKSSGTRKVIAELVKTHGPGGISVERVLIKVKHRKCKGFDTVDSGPVAPKAAYDPMLDFPFLCDPFTQKVVQRSKVLFLMRGLPGSGKSTIVRAITEMYPSSVVCSADDYFLQDGVYKFDATLLSSAHSACQSKAKSSCNAGIPVVIVDNTNVKRWEMKFYLELASHRDYVVVLVVPRTSWRWNPEELVARNKHGVGVEILRRKVEQFDDVIPLYYAWFLNDTSSNQLSFIAHSLLRECIQHFPDLAHRLLWQLQVSPASVQDWQTLWGILGEYYTRGEKSSSLLHCTAKFCSSGRAVGAKTYHAQQHVQNSLGQASTLTITAICFSPRTAGARVQLNEEQMTLFDKPEERDWNGVQPSSGTNGVGSPQKQFESMRNGNGAVSNNGRGSPNQHKRSSGGNRNSPRSSPEKDSTAFPHRGDDFQYKVPNWSGFGAAGSASAKPPASKPGRSAHITLGTACGCASMETIFDTLRLCDMEVLRPGGEGDFVPVTGGKARYFGDGVCCVYFYRPMYAYSIYSGYY